MYQHILVPIDGSPTSSRGLDEAIALATLTGGSLHILHAVDDLSVATGYESYAIYAADILPMLKVAGAKLLDEAKSRALIFGVQSEAVLFDSFSGRVSDLVVQHARTWPADLIVIGTHGRRGFARLVMGSDAEQIMRTSPVPVLLVRATDVAAAESASTAAPTAKPVAETVAA